MQSLFKLDLPGDCFAVSHFAEGIAPVLEDAASADGDAGDLLFGAGSGSGSLLAGATIFVAEIFSRLRSIAGTVRYGEQ